jgi:hypothetical protein
MAIVAATAASSVTSIPIAGRAAFSIITGVLFMFASVSLFAVSGEMSLSATNIATVSCLGCILFATSSAKFDLNFLAFEITPSHTALQKIYFCTAFSASSKVLN